MRPESAAGFQPRFQSLRTLTGLSVDDVSRELGISLRTAYRYEAGTHEPRKSVLARLERLAQDYRRPAGDGEKGGFTFIDLFAGIGGLRLGFDGAGGRCVFTSEWDKKCQETYRANFPDDHEIAGDIRPFADDPSRIPAHDVLLAGFPCQPFSIAGVSKKNSLGRPHGFLDETQGTLFFETARIIRHHRPQAFVLENVKNLAGHDRGRTFSTIMRVLTEELGYHVQHRIVSAEPWVPQKRERIFIVGFREKSGFDIGTLDIPDRSHWPKLGSILDPAVEPKYTLTPRLWQYLQDYKAKHNAAGNGFGYSLFGPGDVARTLSARYFKDGSEILIDQGSGQRPRRLTPRECARLMGFDAPGREFRITVSDCQAYRQFGNAVVVPVARCIASAVVPHLRRAVAVPVMTQDDFRALARACA